MKDETIAVVAGRDPKAHYGAVNTPVYRTSTILFETFEDFAAGVHDPANRKYMYGRIGTPMYIKYKFGASFSDGHTLLRMAKATDNVQLDDGTLVQTASRATVFAQIMRSMERDAPLATAVSFFAVIVVVLVATRTWLGASTVVLSLLMGVTCLIGFAALVDTKLNFLNFVSLPITFGIGCEYPFNVYDRTRLLHGDVRAAVSRVGGAVALCSYTTIIGYGSLMLSDNGALQSFGRLATFGELSCVTMALVFLPSLLQLLAKRSA